MQNVGYSYWMVRAPSNTHIHLHIYYAGGTLPTFKTRTYVVLKNKNFKQFHFQIKELAAKIKQTNSLHETPTETESFCQSNHSLNTLVAHH